MQKRSKRQWKVCQAGIRANSCVVRGEQRQPQSPGQPVPDLVEHHCGATILEVMKHEPRIVQKARTLDTFTGAIRGCGPHKDVLIVPRVMRISDELHKWD